MSQYNIVVSTSESTVVAEYEAEKIRSGEYQSEAALESSFIKMLSEQGYTYLQIHSSDELVKNLRNQLERLNDYKFSDEEWKNFFNHNLSVSSVSETERIVAKTRLIQEDHIQVLKRDDGSSKNIMLINKEQIHSNCLQVINQYTEEKGNYTNRYDVTILVNGFPLVHIELKRRGVALKEAFNQIERYQRDSFWAGNGLYEYAQLFVISNGTNTKYYSNTTRISAVQIHNGKKKFQKGSNSFEFTSYWADASNKVITDIVDFTKTFFQRHTLLNILTKYCVLTSEDMLLVMRPYQIAATESILNRINAANNYKKMGSVEAGGYIWHTTGSGKTLTSFKTAQLASKLSYIDKVIFVVDRKDLDYQTMKEYDRFERGAADGNRNTRILQRQLENKDAKGNPHEYKIIVTTIQKLDRFITANPQHPIAGQHIVLIFDECHRSQFGKMHKKIIKYFNNYHIFGFTGTPIFAKNASSSGTPDLMTTAQAFGDKLHTYTIVDAINDGNVLPFRVDIINTVKSKDGKKDKKVEAINTESALLAPARIREIVSYILEHFDRHTKRNAGSYYYNKLTNISDVAKNQNTAEDRVKVRLNGFNSILAVSSVEAAKLYYSEFKKQLSENSENALKIATIYSYGQNEDDPDGIIDDEDNDNVEGLDLSSREFLESAIQDYNAMFNTAYDTSADKFPNYYKDLSLRMKNREIDLLIVVNMFLTGFDATTLNTLWVDKNLKLHGLIQAFSRTNRILNSIKTFGNIVCFRNLQQEIDDAIALFGDKDASGIVLMKTYKEYYYGYTDENGNHKKGYEELIAELIKKYPLGTKPMGEKAEKDFVALWGNILRVQNILSSFDEFAGDEILSPRDYQDYQSNYLELYSKYRTQAQAENIADDLIFELELVKQMEVNIDYILMLVSQYHKTNCQDLDILLSIEKAVKSSFELRSKKELIDNFISTINAATDVRKDWMVFVKNQKEEDLCNIVAEENLKSEEVRKFIKNAFRDGILKTSGTEIDKLMPAMSRFGGKNRAEMKQRIIEKLKEFFEKYFGLVSEEDC